MSKIQELIKEKCPNGVEYKKLLEMGSTFPGLSGKSKNDFENGNSKYISYMNIFKNPSTNLHSDDFVMIKENEKQNIIKKGDILIAGSSENLEDSGMTSVVTEILDEQIYLNSFCFGFRFVDEYLEKLDPCFLKHLLRDINFREQIKKCSFGVTRFNLNKNKFLNIKIPVPPIEVQNEIVRILDKFVDLETELEEELEARKKQYDTISKNLLQNVEGDEVIIGKRFERLKGTQITASKMKEIQNSNGNIRIFAGGKTMIDALEKDIPNLKITDVPAVLVQSRGLIDFIFYNKLFTFKNEMWAYTNEHEVTVKYLYYVLKDSIQYFKESASRMGSMPQISQNITEKFKFKLPEIEEQQIIVNILDKFDELTNSISKGLPAEIEYRRKQYKYYRNKLLSFEELIVNV